MNGPQRALLACCLLILAPTARSADITIGSKNFTESVIVGDLAQQSLVDAGLSAEHRRQLGGTRILWEALLAGAIDVYPDYTGTLRFEILASEQLADDSALPAALARYGVGMTRSLGFENSYAIAMRADQATELGIRSITDLARHPSLRVALSNEFVDRADGWRALAAAYELPQQPRGLDHDLAYEALASQQVDVIDAYTTDPQIASLSLKLLRDDRDFFPSYEAVFLYRQSLEPAAIAALVKLAGMISTDDMRAMNSAVQLERRPERAVAAAFLNDRLGLQNEAVAQPGLLARLWARTLEHLYLVGIAMAAALLVALPLGIAAARSARLGAIITSVTGLLQTIPSLALFVLLIPLLGIGAAPTIAALFLYSLLPIVRNTHAGLVGIPASLLDSADALGLTRAARLRRIELPLALPTIMAGIKTAAVIAVGLATLGAIIGAGGYGQPIITGIRLRSTRLILEGAIPAAVLALALQGAMELLERRVTPDGLKIRQQTADG
ncbi:MAG: glycine betaine ABC transporter substrate-binding protein [Steroidobacteraceae bacterium]